MTLRTDRRWLTVCLGIFLGVLSVNAAATDPGTVEGQLTRGGHVYTLKHVYAWQPPMHLLPRPARNQLWVYVTNTELPAWAWRERGKPAQLAKENRFRGVKLVIYPDDLSLNVLYADIYGPDGSSNLGAVAPSIWQRLLVDDNRVVGKLQYASTDFSLDVEFSAPVFDSDGKLQMLSGAQAQKSPQAEAFPAFVSGILEHIALLFQDVPAALMSGESRLVAMLVLCVALIAAAIWLARKSLAHYRIIQAVRTAPTVKTNSDARGLVKVVGEAQPSREVPEGEAKPRAVWSQFESYGGKLQRYRRSVHVSVEPILVRDTTGGLIVDPQRAVIVPGAIEGTGYGDLDSTSRFTSSILTGAPVFAIGIIHRGKHRPGETPSHGVLGKSDHGVLLLSAKSESQTLTRFHLRLWPMVAGAALCAWEGVHLVIAFVLPWTPQLR